MSETTANPIDLFTKPVVVELPYQGNVQRDLPYGDDGHVLDIYFPQSGEAATGNALHPVVILVTGFPDPGFAKMTGMNLKDIVQNRCWGKLLAASGIAVVLYTAVSPVADALAVVDWIVTHGETHGLDGQRLGVFSLSGNVPNALHLLHQRQAIQCAALCYGFMLDGEGGTEVADAAAQFHFANPNSADLVLPAALSLLLVRAGQDEFPGLNGSIDRFVQRALLENRDLELINYPRGVHAFDIHDDSLRAQQLVRRVVQYFQQRLAGT